MPFGDRLKLLRKEKDLTQQNIADILKVERPTIAGYETNRKQPDYEKVGILAEYFNVSLDYLLGHSDVRNPYKKEFVNTDSKETVKDKTLNDDLIDLMIKYDIIKDKNSVNEKHLEFIKYAIETYKNEQNSK